MSISEEISLEELREILRRWEADFGWQRARAVTCGLSDRNFQLYFSEDSWDDCSSLFAYIMLHGTYSLIRRAILYLPRRKDEHGKIMEYYISSSVKEVDGPDQLNGFFSYVSSGTYRSIDWARFYQWDHRVQTLKTFAQLQADPATYLYYLLRDLRLYVITPYLEFLEG